MSSSEEAMRKRMEKFGASGASITLNNPPPLPPKDSNVKSKSNYQRMTINNRKYPHRYDVGGKCRSTSAKQPQRKFAAACGIWEKTGRCNKPNCNFLHEARNAEDQDEAITRKEGAMKSYRSLTPEDERKGGDDRHKTHDRRRSPSRDHRHRGRSYSPRRRDDNRRGDPGGYRRDERRGRSRDKNVWVVSAKMPQMPPIASASGSQLVLASATQTQQQPSVVHHHHGNVDNNDGTVVTADVVPTPGPGGLATSRRKRVRDVDVQSGASNSSAGASGSSTACVPARSTKARSSITKPASVIFPF